MKPETETKLTLGVAIFAIVFGLIMLAIIAFGPSTWMVQV
jgi:hypothetical protein